MEESSVNENDENKQGKGWCFTQRKKEKEKEKGKNKGSRLTTYNTIIFSCLNPHHINIIPSSSSSSATTYLQLIASGRFVIIS